jgi:hypothetical protein
MARTFPEVVGHRRIVVKLEAGLLVQKAERRVQNRAGVAIVPP